MKEHKIGNKIHKDLVLDLANRIVKEDLSVRELEKISSEEVIPKRKPIAKSPKISLYGSFENVMRDKLGVRVQISKDKITIPFDSSADLARILEILNIEMDDN